jgi:Deoxyribodipyrimidine photolyase
LEKDIIIHWFRQDLRIQDNPSLYEAAQKGAVLPVYILDDQNAKDHCMGGASRWWLHYSLLALNKSLKGKLVVYCGDPKKILIDLVEEHNVKAVHWNRCYEPWRITRDKSIKKSLEVHSIETNSFNGSLLWEPWEILKKDATPYKVFTPYFRNGCLQSEAPRLPLPKPEKVKWHEDAENNLSIYDLKLLPKIKWDKQLEPHWKIGELAALKKLKAFSNKKLENYKQGRDFPALNTVSRLSPHLHYGEISPNQAWYAAKKNKDSDDLDRFLSEMGWREFSHSLLYHFPKLPRENLQSKFDKFPWLQNKKNL